MQELEKILEEIDQEKKNAALSIRHTTGYKAGQIRMAERIEEIIRKHMNDGWIPVERGLPEDGETVLCTDGEYVYLVEYDADLDAPFGDMDGITDWQSSPEPPERSEEE